MTQLVTDLGEVFKLIGGSCGAFFIFGMPGELARPCALAASSVAPTGRVGRQVEAGPRAGLPALGPAPPGRGLPQRPSLGYQAGCTRCAAFLLSALPASTALACTDSAWRRPKPAASTLFLQAPC